MQNFLWVAKIINGTSVDGPGLRTAVYLSGCNHQCPGCHNPETWDMANGKKMDIESVLESIEESPFNVTFTGGDPLLQIEPLTELTRKIKATGRTIWCYTGYVYEGLVKNPVYREFLELIDVLVDGPFIEDQRDISLIFRGSSNQRLIDCKQSLAQQKIVNWESDF